MKNAFYLLLTFISISLSAQDNTNNNVFRQLGNDLASPNSYRTASGAPGHEYWQQDVDYQMSLTLQDDEKRLYGEETIHYTNNSPDDLPYLWVQLDQNVRAQDSDSHAIGTESINPESTSTRTLNRLNPTFDGGFKIESVSDGAGNALNYAINKTMMRVDLGSVVRGQGGTTTLKIKWWYNINNTREIGGRSGYEQFADGHRVYCIAQFFPRLAKYNDVLGWQNKQFLGRGEFALEFGDYEVEISVPKDHLVAATGELQNPNKVLSAEHRNRLDQAMKEYEQPVMIQTIEEAQDNAEEGTDKYQTWKFKASNIRDFAFATSRRFIWDAMGVKMSDGRTVMASSMWVPEGDCLWKKFSTKAVAHTVKWYSHYTFDYPYPVAYSIDGSMGMEYPMICFNYGRCESDDTYTKRMKYGHIGVIIHEVGHNWFPMIVNSDERQWTWMDEGLNTYVQYLTQQHWERNYPHRRGPANLITNYMGGDKSKISPIMTNSESIWQFGNNAYGKPATALNILRETVVGRELFDYAFREYSNRWKFKNPYPSDFFRTIEDASGVDLDWFWRGWFYTNDHVDQALTSVKHYNLDSGNPVEEKNKAREMRDNGPRNISRIRENEIQETYSESDPSIIDFYSTYDELVPDAIDEAEYEQFYNNLSASEKELLESGMNYYELTIENNGGLVMPVILQFNYVDGTSEDFRIPVEVWRFNAEKITKVIPTKKEVESIVLDPYLEIADVNTDDNAYPPRRSPSRFEAFKNKKPRATRENPMQRARRAAELEKEVKP